MHFYLYNNDLVESTFARYLSRNRASESGRTTMLYLRAPLRSKKQQRVLPSWLYNNASVKSTFAQNLHYVTDLSGNRYNNALSKNIFTRGLLATQSVYRSYNNILVKNTFTLRRVTQLNRLVAVVYNNA
jgi:hypothetical protein